MAVNYDLQLTSIARKRKLAEALQQMGAKQPDPNQMAGGMVVKTSPLAALAPILQSGLGTYGVAQADKQEADVTNQRNSAVAEALKKYGTPGYGDDPLAAAQEMISIGGPGAAIGGKMMEREIAPDVKYQDAGDHYEIIRNGVVTGKLQKGVSPDSKLSSETSRRGQDLSAQTATRGQDLSAQTAVRGQDIGANTAASGQAVTIRGQDIGADTAAAGRDNALKIAQTRSGQASKVPALASLDYVADQMRSALKNVSTGGIGGIKGKLGTLTDYQDKAAVENLAQQLSTEIRTMFRIPGEGAISDKEQAQYGIQLPSTNYDAATNEKIITDLQNRARLRMGQPIMQAPGSLQPPQQNGGWHITEE
jgi:hypothetical protein